MVPFLRQWNGVGYGLMGEQGAESVYAEFNSLLRRYTNIPNQVERLRYVLQLYIKNFEEKPVLYL